MRKSPIYTHFWRWNDILCVLKTMVDSGLLFYQQHHHSTSPCLHGDKLPEQADFRPLWISTHSGWGWWGGGSLSVQTWPWESVQSLYYSARITCVCEWMRSILSECSPLSVHHFPHMYGYKHHNNIILACFTNFSNLISPKLITASVKGHVEGIWGGGWKLMGPLGQHQNHTVSTSVFMWNIWQERVWHMTHVPLKTLISKPKYYNKLSFVCVQSL